MLWMGRGAIATSVAGAAGATQGFIVRIGGASRCDLADQARGPCPAARGLRLRRIECAGDLREVVAPRDWPGARVEAWLSWSSELPTDDPPGDLPSALAPDTPFDPLLGGGPDRYARRLAAWGWALGLFDAEADAQAFRGDLFALLARGALSSGPMLAFGARVHPLADDPARSRPPPLPISTQPISPRPSLKNRDALSVRQPGRRG